MKTLNEDFDGWWEILAKYRKRDIEARNLYGDQLVLERFADYRGKDWPGKETGVQYYVRLKNNVYVGMREARDPVSNRRARFAEFPIYDLDKKEVDTAVE